MQRKGSVQAWYFYELFFLAHEVSFYVGPYTCSINTGTAFRLICTTAAMQLFPR